MSDDIVDRLRRYRAIEAHRAADLIEAQAAKIAELEGERDKARQYGLESRLREKASEDARVSAVDRIAKLEAALQAIDHLLHAEVNPSNYDHDEVCELNSNAIEAGMIAAAALAKAEGRS